MVAVTAGEPDPGLAEIEVRVRAGLSLVEARLADAVRAADAFVAEAASYLVAAGGKRFRPTLVLLAGHFGDPAAGKLVDAATAIELTHVSTLYHDDVIDEAGLRRGARSANARFGNRIAILTGDYLFARASEITAGLGSEPTRILSRAIARMCQGQILEARGALPGADPVEHYLAVLADKTGALISAACRLGGLLAGAPGAAVEALSSFGDRLGVAFQLGDDLLDVVADRSAAGKVAGTDLRAGVLTLPVLCLLRSGDPGVDEVARVALGSGSSDADVARALAALRASPAMDEARAMAQAELDAAWAALDELPAGPARRALAEVATRVLDRPG